MSWLGWVGETDGTADYGPCDTLDELKREVKTDIGEGDLTLFVGQAEPYPLRIDADDVLERLDEQYLSEVLDDYGPFFEVEGALVRDLEARLNFALSSWMADLHIPRPEWTPNVECITVEEPPVLARAVIP